MEFAELSNEALARQLAEKIQQYEESALIQAELLKEVKQIRDIIERILKEIEIRNDSEIRTEN